MDDAKEALLEAAVQRRRDTVLWLTDKVMRGETVAVEGMLGCRLDVDIGQRVVVMTAIARQLIPKNWEWEVVEMAGRPCQLFIGRVFDADPDH